MKVKKLLLVGCIGACLLSAQAFAVQPSGWKISSSYIWRLLENSDYAFTKGSPAKTLQLDKTIMHRQAVFHVAGSLTNRYTFKVGCMYQNPTPAIELDVTTLDIGIRDLSRGFVFARFLVDSGQELSLRGEIVPPSRIIFTPLTKSQEKKLSDLFLQLSEGGYLYIALLQGESWKPRVFTIPLEGFFDASKIIMEDCKNLSSLIMGSKGAAEYFKDYVSREPYGSAPKDYTLKKKPQASDGLTPPEEPKAEPEPEPVKEEPVKEEKEEPPSILPFEPGGGRASIGDDGKPITSESASSESNDNLGTAKSMKIDENGNPIAE